MFRSPQQVPELNRHVTELPPEFSVHRGGNTWIVLGPTGLFAIGRADDDVVAAAGHLAGVAHELRDLLGEVTTWVPFVDVLLIADQERHDLACAVIELDSLSMALTVGGRTLDEMALARLRHGLGQVLQRLGGSDRRPLDPA